MLQAAAARHLRAILARRTQPSKQRSGGFASTRGLGELSRQVSWAWQAALHVQARQILERGAPARSKRLVRLFSLPPADTFSQCCQALHYVVVARCTCSSVRGVPKRLRSDDNATCPSRLDSHG